VDAQRFDRITRSFATRASRRGLVGGLAALLAVGGTAPITAASDATCQGEPAISNRTCPTKSCSGNPFCRCAVTVKGDKTCVETGDLVPCPTRDECDRNRDCRKGEVCIKVGGCCLDHPKRNLCIARCG